MGRSALRRKKRKRKVSLFTIATSIVIFLVIIIFVVIFTNRFAFTSSLSDLLTASQMERFDPDGIQVIDADYTIDTPDEKLEDVRVIGNLYLGPGIGEGSVDLINVMVEGSVLVRGGGMNSVFMRDCIFDQVKVNRSDGRVRLVFSGKTFVENIYLETGARLVENISEEGLGVKSVQVLTEEKVELAGEYETIQILAGKADLDLVSTNLKYLFVDKTADGTTISYPDNIYIENLQLDGSAYLFGRGSVNRAVISAGGISELEGHFDRVEIMSEAGFFNLIEGSTYQELVVSNGALNNDIYLYEDVTINKLELNEAVQVEGKGDILKVIINATGSTLEQIPHEIEFLQDVSVVVDGHEISTSDMLKALRQQVDPNSGSEPMAARQETALEPEPEPESETRAEPTEETAPDPEPEEPEADPDPEAEDKEEAGEGDEGPDYVPPGFELEILIPEEGDEILLQGKNLLFITLNTSRSDLYRVILDGEELIYLEVVKQFYGLVDQEAQKSDLEGKIEVLLKE